MNLMHNNLSRRRLLQLIAVGGCAAALAACTPSVETTPAPDPEAPPVEPAPKADIKLSLWWHEYGEEGTQAASVRIAQEYSEQTPGITVDSVWNPGDYRSRLYAAMAAGTGPDAYEDNVTVDNVANQYAAVMDDVFIGVEDDFLEPDLNRVTVKGHRYAIPMMVDFHLICSRTSMLEEKGLEHPKTWDELVNAAVALTEGRRKGLYLGNDGGIGTTWQRLGWSAGVNFFMEEDPTPEIRFDVEEMAIAWNKLKELDETGALLIGAPTDWWDPAAFNQGLCAIQYIGFWSTAAIIAAVGDDYQLSAFPPVPIGGNSGRYSTPRAGWCALVNAKGPHIPEAIALQKWLWIDNTDFQLEWNTAYGYKVLPRSSLNEKATKLASGPPAVATQHVTDYGLFIGTAWTGAMNTACSDALTDVVKQGVPAEQGVQNAAARCRTELETVLEVYDRL